MSIDSLTLVILVLGHERKEIAKECIEQQIEKLEDYLALSAPEENMHNIISDIKLDLDNKFIQQIFKKAIYLPCVLQDAINLI